jgi:hypothetical protein
VRVKARTYQRPDGDPVGGLGDWPRGCLPLWARWNDDLDQPYTLGVEEELMLLEPVGWSLAQSSDHVLARLSDELSRHTFPETHAAVVELAMGIHPGVDGVVAELTSLRNRLSCELDPMGLIPVREMLDSLLAECRPHALALGCAGALDRVERLAAANGAARQRELVAPNGRLDDLVASLADRFHAPYRRASVARDDPRHTSDPTERSGTCAAGSHTPAPPSS